MKCNLSVENKLKNIDDYIRFKIESNPNHENLLKKFASNNPSAKQILYNRKDITNATIFNIDSDLINLLFLTDNNYDLDKIPYNNIFINLNKNILGKFCIGINIINVDDELGSVIIVYYLKNDILECIFINWMSDDNNKFNNEIILFLKNLFAIISEREYSDICLIEKQKSKNYNFNKFIKNFNRVVIIPTGELKKYINELNENKAFSYLHKFWVRGHWRKYITYKRWIKPYIKGNGILVKKQYFIKK